VVRTRCDARLFLAMEFLLMSTLDQDAMDHFRAISATEEHSERALELTESIIRKNPAHYTVW